MPSVGLESVHVQDVVRGVAGIEDAGAFMISNSQDRFDPDVYRQVERDRRRAHRETARERQPRLFRAAFSYDPTSFEEEERYNIGSLPSMTCQYCRAYRFRDKKKSMCCSEGTVDLTPFLSPPQPLASLLDGDHEELRHFLANIRLYNDCFQMTSFGKTAPIVPMAGWNPSSRLCGQIFHRIGSALPVANAEPSIMQNLFHGRNEHADR